MDNQAHIDLAMLAKVQQSAPIGQNNPTAACDLMMGILSQVSCYWNLEQRRRQAYFKVALQTFSLHSVSVKLLTSRSQFAARVPQRAHK